MEEILKGTFRRLSEGNSKRKNLKFLLDNYDHVIWDTSAIISPVGESASFPSKNSATSFKNKEEFYSVLEDSLKGMKGIYITEGVKREIAYENPGVVHAKPKERYERVNQDIRLALEFSNAHRKISYDRLSGKQRSFYKDLSEIFNDFCDLNSISETDRDIVLTGYSLAKYGENVAIISNDSDLKELSSGVHSYIQSGLFSRDLKESRLGAVDLFKRESFCSFSKWKGNT